MFDDDSEKEKRKVLFRKVAGAIKENPETYVESRPEYTNEIGS